MSMYSGDIDNLNLQYYLQSSREQLQVLGNENVIRNQTNQKRGDIFTNPNDSENRNLYKYHVPINFKTEGSYPDQFQDRLIISTIYPQSPANLTLAQLNSKSFFINNIMKRDSKELLEHQKQIAQAVSSSNNLEQRIKLQEGLIKRKKNYSNQLSFDQQKLQDNILIIQNQNEKNQFSNKRMQLMSSETNRQKINKMRNIQQQTYQNTDDSIQTLKQLPIHLFQKRKPSALASFVTTSNHTSSHTSPQNEIIKQRESIFSFGKKQSLKNIGGQNYLPDLNNKSASNQQKQQNKSKKQQVQQHLSGILNNTQLQQTQSFNNSQSYQKQNQQQQHPNQILNNQQKSQFITNTQSLGQFNQIGTINSFPHRNQQNYILIGKKNSQNSLSSSNINQFSQTSYNDRMYKSSYQNYKNQQKKYNVFNNYMNPNDTDDNDTDDYNEMSKDQQKQKNIHEDVYGQKFIKRNDFISKTQENSQYKIQDQGIPQKSLNPFQTNPHPFPSEQNLNQGISNSQFKPVESLSYYYQNQNQNQSDLMSERTNLNAPNDLLLKQNSFEDGKWKIEKSDNVDMEASRKMSSASSLSPNKIFHGNLFSQQITPNQFFPQTNLNGQNDNSPHTKKNEYQKINNSSSIEINKKIQIQHQRSDSEDSQLQSRNDKLIQNQIQIINIKEIPQISIDNKTQNDQTSNSKILRELSQASSKSIVPIIQDEQRQINRQASSSLSLQVSQYNTDNLKSDKQAIQSQSLMKQFSNQQQQSLQQQSSNNLILQQKSNQNVTENMIQGSEKEIKSLNFDKEQTNININSIKQNQNTDKETVDYKKKQTLEKQLENAIDYENTNQTYNSVSSIKIKDIIGSRNSSESKNSYQSKESREYTRIIKNNESNEIKDGEKNIKNNEIKNISSSQNSKVFKQSQNSFGNSLNHLSSGYDSMNEDKNLQISSIIVSQNKNKIKQEGQNQKDIQIKNMATVLEKSENQSERTIPTLDNIESNIKKNSPKKVDFQSEEKNQKISSQQQINIIYPSKDNQLDTDINQSKNNEQIQKSNLSLGKENEVITISNKQPDQIKKSNIKINVSSFQVNDISVDERESSKKEIESPIRLNGSSEKQMSSSQKKIGSATQINSQERIENTIYKNQSSIKQIIDDQDNGSNNSVKKKRSLSEKDVISQKIISFENPSKIDMALIIQLQSEKNINGNNSSEQSQNNEKTVKSQIRTRSETFKGKQDDELQINVVPPDNCTPLSNRSTQQNQYNFVDMVQIAENQNYINPGNKNQKSIVGSQNQQSEQNIISVNGNDKNSYVTENKNIELESSQSESQTNKASNTNNSPRFVNSQSTPQSMIKINITSVNNPSGQYGLNINSDQQNHGNSQQSIIVYSNSSSTLNQDDLSQGGSKNNISPQNKSYVNFQKNQQNYERQNINGYEQLSAQQLNIQNHLNYQKLVRQVKSSDDSQTFHQIGEEQKNQSSKEEYSNTTKNSAKKSESIDKQVLNFQNEPDIQQQNSEKNKIFKKLQVNTNSNQPNSPLLPDKSKNSKRNSFDGTNSRRSSVLTPQQIKNIKKESRFYHKMSIYNKSFIDSEDPLLVNIYGQENTQFVELKDICDFNEYIPSQSNFFRDDDNVLMNAILNGNQDSSQFTQSQQRELNFKKLIYQISHSKQNPYIETFEQPKGDSTFQKNVKTLFRKTNQYFKTKYHYDNTSNQQDGSRVGSRLQSQDNTVTRKNQVYPNIKTVSSKGIGFSVSDKSLPKDKKSIQTDLAQSDEIEQEDNKPTSVNVELQKSDIEKLNQKLSKRDKNGIIIISTKSEETPKDMNNQVQGMDKQNTLDRVAGILRNSKKKQSQKLIIQINPPVDEPTKVTMPHIKLDFQAIKKKNGNTEFVLDYKNIQDSDSLQSSDDDDEIDEDRNIDGFPNYFFQREQKILSLKNFDFINRSQDSWDESFFSTQNMVIEQNDISQKGFYNNKINQNSDSRKKFSDDSQKLANLEEQNTFDEKILSTLRFVNHNSWRFVKNYQITYLEKQIDKGFLQKVQKLTEFLKNLKNKIDPTNGYKLENLIMLNNNIYGSDDYKVFLKRDQKAKSLQNLIYENLNKNQEKIDMSQIYLYEHIFQKDFVNDYEKKRQNEELSSSDEGSDDSLSESKDSSSEEIDLDTYFNLSDQDKELSDKNQFVYDEEDYDVSRAQYLLKVGYLEPTIINESSNMFTQLNEQIVPVQSGIDNEYINQILKSRGKNERNIASEIKQQSHIEKKFRTINKMINQLDFRSSQTDMKNIQSEYNELLEGNFEDNFKIDHDFYKKEFIKLQQQQINKFISHQKNLKRKQLTIQGTKKVNPDSQGTVNISINGSNLQIQQSKQQIKERSPRSIPDLYDIVTSKLKGQDNNKQIQQQYQNFSNSLPHYQQQQSNTLQQLQLQQQQQLQMQQQQQQQQNQHFQQLQQAGQTYNLQQNSSHIHNIIQQNTLPSNSMPYNIISQQNQQITSSQRIPNPPEQGNPTPHIKNIFNKGFTQSLKSLTHNQSHINTGNATLQYITGYPQKTEPNIRSQVTIKNEEDQANLYKNISKINTPQSFKSDIHASSTIQSNYNKTSTLQSQQSIFNQSESLHNKDAVTMASQDNSKQGIKVSESQFVLQKTNTNHSADENQLTAPSPSQISKKNIRTAGRKRSMFNTSSADNQNQNINQQQQQSNTEQNRNHHSPLSLHSPNFAYHSQSGQNNNLPQFLSNKSNSSKSINQFNQTQQNSSSPILPQNSIQNQTSINQQPKTQKSFNLNSYSQVQKALNVSQQLQNPQQLQQGEVPSTPVRSPYRGGTIIQQALMNNIMQMNQPSQQSSLNQVNTSNAITSPFLQQTHGSLGRQNSNQQIQVFPNTITSPSNLNLQNYSLLQSNQLKPYPSQTQLDTLESKQIKSNRTFSSLTATKDLEKSTSMDRQNLVMRTRLQQNIKRRQLNYADQVFSAIKENNIHEIEDLLNQHHSLSLESKDEDGNTFIIIAAQVGSREIVEYLFQKGADINAQNIDGDTALHKANFYQYHIVADFLIQNGAQQNKLNNNGMNPWGCYPSSKR